MNPPDEYPLAAVRGILARIGDPFDSAVAVACAWLVVGAYVDASSRLVPEGSANPLAPWQEVVLDSGWLLVTALLVVRLGRNLSRGVPWARALPEGYRLSLIAGLVFGAAVVGDMYWQLAWGFGRGLEALLSPIHLVELVAGGAIVAGPLLAAARRGDPVARLPALTSAALLLSSLSFVTQFVHPLVDLWPARADRAPAQVVWWAAQDLGAAAVLVQAGLLAGAVLLLLGRFRLVPGSLVYVLTIYGALAAVLKGHYELIPVTVAAGLAADLLVWRFGESARRPERARLVAAAVSGSFAAVYFAAIQLTGGIWQYSALAYGLVLAAAVEGWLLGHVVRTWRLATAPPAADVEPRVRAGVLATPEDVKAALEVMAGSAAPADLAGSPLVRLPCIRGDGLTAAEELHSLLVELVREVAASRSPRDAEAGQVLVACYLKRSGSHETVAELLHLSRPTFYRRLQRGIALVAERLDELAEFSLREAARL